MDTILIGGPCHGDILEVIEEKNTMPAVLQVAVARDPEESKQWAALGRIGIEPPVGSLVLYYAHVGDFIDPAVYFYVHSEGSLPEEEEV